MSLVNEHGEVGARAIKDALVKVEERGHGADHDAVSADKRPRELPGLATLPALIDLAFGVNDLDGSRCLCHVDYSSLELAIDHDAIGDDENLAEQ